MDKTLKLSVSPHIHSGKSTAGIMRDVIIALLPTTVAGVIIFGLRSIAVIAACVLSSVAFEAIFNYICKKDQTVGDLSAAVTGLLLALNLPANIPLWQCVIGSMFAIIIVKCLFGGIGCNAVNPAITARVFMLVAFSSLTHQAMPKVVDTVSGATPLSMEAGAAAPSLFELFIGLKGGAIGEVCGAALLLGFIYLLFRRVITWHIPLSFVGCVFLISLIIEGGDWAKSLSFVLSGGLLIGAIFMATDYVTSPATPKGKLIFGVGAGIITVLIRYYGVYPEGVSFGILFMNILTPYIDVWTKHRVFGSGGRTNE